jgi:hypothetical protein
MRLRSTGENREGQLVWGIGKVGCFGPETGTEVCRAGHLATQDDREPA